jgi:hypothetical protein
MRFVFEIEVLIETTLASRLGAFNTYKFSIDETDSLDQDKYSRRLMHFVFEIEVLIETTLVFRLGLFKICL